MKMFKDTKAVSPVIGIMLMLVVTVILAAAVSSTSTGLMKSTEKAPMAVFDVKVAKDVEAVGMPGTMSYMTVKHVTGDAIQTKDLKIVTLNSNAEGTQIREKLPSESGVYGAYESEGNVPYWNNMGMGGFGSNPTVDFGNYTLKPGVSMTAQDFVNIWGDDNVAAWNVVNSDYDLGTNNSIGQMQDMFADWNNVSKGDFVNVKIIHMPSNKVIYSSDVEVV